MALEVYKFGGVAVGTPDAIRAAVGRIAKARAKGHIRSLDKLLSMVLSARSMAGADASCSLNVNPDCANTCAIPFPIVPAPITPTVLIIYFPVGRGFSRANWRP